MSISIHEKKKEYADSKSLEILAMIKYSQAVKKRDKSESIPLPNYLKEKKIIELGEILGPLDMSQEDGNGRIVEKYRNFKNQKKVGFDESGFREIYKLIDTLLKEQSISSNISEKFLVDNIFDWLIGRHQGDLENTTLSDYLIENGNKSIASYTIYLRILYLDSNKSFTIGKTNFSYLTEAYIKKLSLRVDEDKRDNFLKAFLHYKGQFMGSCSVKAEENKAIELAIKQVTLSVDLLKITSPTIDFPNVPIFFDVDFRNIHQLTSHVLVQSVERNEDFKIRLFGKPYPFVIDDRIWEYMAKSDLGLLHQFVEKTFSTRTELTSLIYNGIENFSKAISNLNLHERVTQIFTVLESLLLPNDSSGIIDSVCKYLPKLITGDAEERKQINSIIREMYTVRSAMMHHARKKDFENKNLAMLQFCTRTLITQLIILSAVKKTKNEILQEIDDLINRA